VSLDEIDRSMPREAAECIRDHVTHSPGCSIAKAKRVLGYQPRYTSEQIYAECLEYLLETGQLRIE
jgi:nucleoside-diphosphate-sugar epimerase